jgi:hypothetical protein
MGNSYPTPLEVAQAFHEAYESFAPMFGYSTRLESAKPWAQVPQANRDLMVATVRAVMIEKYDLLRPEAERV